MENTLFLGDISSAFDNVGCGTLGTRLSMELSRYLCSHKSGGQTL